MNFFNEQHFSPYMIYDYLEINANYESTNIPYYVYIYIYI